MATFPVAEELERTFDEKRATNWERLLAIREEVLKALEPVRAAKTISANLEARVPLDASGDLAELVKKYGPNLPALPIVSQVEVSNRAPRSPQAGESGEVRIHIDRARGAKCERCWNYSTHVGESADYPTICERCVAALAEIERDGGVLAEKAKS